MLWNKLGLVFAPSVFDWSAHTALQPTPIILDDRIRVYVGSRDAEGISRIGFVDLALDDPRKVINYSKSPVLDIGADGCFDESGVVPSALVKAGGKIYMFYAGYQLGSKVRFSVLGGLAISDDDGLTFTRAKRTPVFERNTRETIFRVPHSVIYENNKWKAWYGGGDRFIQGKSKTLPLYDIRYTESDTELNFDQEGTVLLTTKGDEYRLGRPFVFKKTENDYYLFYGYSTEDKPYCLGCARSTDLKEWTRQDELLNLGLSDSGWDSEMIAYPSVIEVNKRVYMMYNGNDYGREGFGIAELVDWRH